MGRRRTISVEAEVDVDLDLDDVFREVSDEDLRQELRAREGKRGGPAADPSLLEVYRCLLRNNKEEAIVILNSLLFPRFSRAAAAKAALPEHAVQQ